MSFPFFYSEQITLAQQAKAKADEFHKKKEQYMNKWTEQLIGMVKEKIFMKAGLGEYQMVFVIDKHVFDLKELKSSTEGNFLVETEKYEITNRDKDDLMTRIIQHFADEEKYPDLTCRAEPYYSYSIRFSWNI
jgi:hypothetical protein